MSFNTFGKFFRFTTWGESHGPAIGCVIDGCPPNIPLSEKDIQRDMDRRRPGQSKFTTQRKESDKAIILSGVFEGKTTGTPISIIIHNEDKRSRDYETIKNKFRPGHADYTYFKKYGIRDYRGGGRQSARETACRVAAGAVAKIVLKQLIGSKFNVIGAVTQLGLMSCDKSNWKDSEIRKNPFYCPDKKSIYSKLDTDIAAALMSINAVKGVNIGAGMNAAFLSGEENSDEMSKGFGKVKFKSNQAGGILGGISSGQNIVASFAVKPTSSILTSRDTIDKKGKNTKISVKGRHDPCVGIRAVPIGEAMINCVLLDHFLMHRAQCS